MAVNHTSTPVSSLTEFCERINNRRRDSACREAMCCGVWQVARSAQRHLQRFDLAAKRLERAIEAKDKRAIASEKDTMLALLYETVDTVYIVVQMLNPDALSLESVSDESSFSGEDAHFVYDLLQLLERVCAQALRSARIYNLDIDFKRAVQEREGVTYQTHGHWLDFSPGSTERSFFDYFAHAQHAVGERLGQVPKFWKTRTFRQALARANRPALREVLFKLENASFPRLTLTQKIERAADNEPAPRQRHWTDRSVKSDDSSTAARH